MGSGSATLPAKRPMSSSSTVIPATEPTTNPNPNPKSQPKRSKKKHPTNHNKSGDLPIPVPAGHASFRLLCHSSRIGGVIGKSGSVINALRIATASKIHVDTATGAEVSDRVVTVVAPAGAAERVSLRSQFGGEFSAEVTKAQEALLRVYDRILEVAAESGAVGAAGFGVVSCRMLTDAAGASAVIGKGGKIVERIKKETGTRIKVLKDDLPTCASSTDEMIEIEGDVLAVKKALVSVSNWLQACSLGTKAKSSGSFEAVPAQTSPDLHSAHFSQRNFVSPNFTTSSTNLPTGGSSVGYTSGLYQSPLEAERRPSFSAKEVSFKILCSNDKIGGVIGKGGSVVRILQDESGASVSVGSSVAECDDRVITISASEDPESRYSAAQKAVVMVFSKSEQESKSSSITARLVVPSNQVGCILGRGGVIISEIRKITGASIRIIGPGGQGPKCLSANDEVVQISGDFSSVQDALYNLTGRLRENLLANSVSSASTTRSLPYTLPETSPYGNRNQSFLLADTEPYGRIREPNSLVYDSEPVIYHINGSPYVDVTNSLRRHENSNGLGPSYTLDWPTSPEQYAYERPPSPRQYTYDRPPSPRQYAYERPPSPRQWTSQMASGGGSIGIPEIGRGLTSLRGGLELGSGNKSAIVTNTTVEIIVPEHVIGSVYGENGNNLTRLRQISGARVIVHEPRPGTSDRVIVISGTPDETQAAQSLLHAFILTGT